MLASCAHLLNLNTSEGKQRAFIPSTPSSSPQPVAPRSHTMSSFPINLAQLVAFFMESVAWGIQIITFTQCIWALFEADKSVGGRRNVNVTLLTYAVALFVWGTLDISFAAFRNITAFVYYMGPGGSIEIFSQISNYVTVLRVRTTSRCPHAWLNQS